MNGPENRKFKSSSQRHNGKYLIAAPNHAKQVLKSLVGMIESSYLVDIAICCGPSTIQAHKIILAANSPFFKENLENGEVAQIIITGMEFSVLKSFIEYMYYGEMCVYEEHMKYFFAGARLFQIPNMEAIFTDADMHRIAGEQITIPPPKFIKKPPKYPIMYKPLNSIDQRGPGYCLVSAYKPKNTMNPAQEGMSTYANKLADKVLISSSVNDPPSVGNHEGLYSKNFAPIDIASAALPKPSITPQTFELSSSDRLTAVRQSGDKNLELLLKNSDGTLDYMQNDFLKGVSDEQIIQVITASGQAPELQSTSSTDPIIIDVPYYVDNELEENPPVLNASYYPGTDLRFDDMINPAYTSSTTMQMDNFESPYIDGNCDSLMTEEPFDPNVFLNSINETNIHANNTEYD